MKITTHIARHYRQLGTMIAALLLALLPAYSATAAPLASDQIRILGVSLEIAPETLTAPRNVPILLNTALVDGDGNDVSKRAEYDGTLVRAELSGPGVDGVQTLEAEPGDPLAIGPLLLVGNYVVENIRLFDGAGTTIIRGSPDLVPIKIIERVIVSQVRSRPLSLDEIRDRGIIIGDENFTAFEFTFGLETESGKVPITFDVAFPQDEELLDEGGSFGFPPILPELDVPNLDVQGIILERAPFEDETFELPTGRGRGDVGPSSPS